jgi:hypothetical protein
MSSPLAAPPVAKAKALFCPNCGGPVERRGFGHTLTVACPQCLTVLDVSTPLVSILQRAEIRQRRQPLIPLGSRGHLHGTEWEAIGFQVREIEVEGERYEWEEYLLFNPYAGFRYLTQYNGHWNWVEPSGAQATLEGKSAMLGGRVFRYFASAVAETTYVLGEFPWRVTVGERVRAVDFIAPPYILSAEVTHDEITWSHGVYTSGAEIWSAFGLSGAPPRAAGVYLNQPGPARASLWGPFAWMAIALLAMMLLFTAVSKRRVVLNERRTFALAAGTEPSYVTPVFELSGRPAPLEIAVDTDLSNNYAYFNFALINEETGQAYDFGREVSYYSGVDSDGSWTEGSKSESVLLPAVPPGRYYLRVEPEMDPSGAAGVPRMTYQLRVREDVPYYGWFLAAGVLLAIPPGLSTWRAYKFEQQRWEESDGARRPNMTPAAGKSRRGRRA